MTAMDLAAACRRHVREAAQLAEQLEELEENMVRMGGGIGSAPVQCSLTDRFSGYAARRDEIDARLKHTRRMMAAEQMALILLTDTLPDVQRRCAREFYCYGRGAVRLADDMGYTVSNVYKTLHAVRDALLAIPEDAVEEKLPVSYWKEAEKGEDE